MSGRKLPCFTFGNAKVTQRQRDVWKLMASSETTKGIALAMHLSPKTVERHRADLYKRLGIFDVAGITRAAIRTGLIKA